MEQRITERVAFGGGCFWCTEAVFLLLKGVIAVTPGYAGGETANPTYESVSSGITGHAEVIQVEYDPQVIPFKKLLEIFFMSHDPTSVNRQGNDVGTQYRSILLYSIPEQRKEAGEYIQELIHIKRYTMPIVTQIVELIIFYPAEEYHKDYYARHTENSYSEFVIKPKVEKVRKHIPELLRIEKTSIRKQR